MLKRPRQRKLARGDVKYNIPVGTFFLPFFCYTRQLKLFLQDLGLRCDTPAARWYRENRTRIDEEYPLGTWMRVLMMGKLYGMVPNFWKDLSNILAVSSLVWGLDRTVLPRIWAYALPVLISSIVIRHGLPFAQI